MHEEIDRLPGAYRSAVVVCYLQGKSQAQAACSYNSRRRQFGAGLRELASCSAGG